MYGFRKDSVPKTIVNQDLNSWVAKRVNLIPKQKKGIVVDGIQFDAVVCSSVMRPHRRLHGRCRCRIHHDDFIITPGPDEGTAKVGMVFSVNFRFPSRSFPVSVTPGR